MSVNKVILIGNLGADPEVRFTNGGKAVGEMRIATTSGSKDKETTEWHRVVLWEKNAENAAKFLKKGRQVYVEGRIQTRTYDDKDGNKRYITEVVANHLQFLGGPAGAPGPDADAMPPGADSDIPF